MMATLAWPMSDWKEIVLIREGAVRCPHCQKIVHATLRLQYKTTGVTNGGARDIMGRISRRKYFYVCEVCEEDWEIPETPALKEMAEQVIPWRDRWGLFIVLAVTTIIMSLVLVGSIAQMIRSG